MSSRTVGFPEFRLAGLAFPLLVFPASGRLKCWHTYTPPSPGLPPGSSSVVLEQSYWGQSPIACARTKDHQVRGPLCPPRVLPGSEWHRTPLRGALPPLRRSYWPMRRTKSLARVSVSLFLGVFAGCRQSLLGSGSSRRYFLCSLPGRLDPYPAVSSWCPCSFLPKRHRSHHSIDWFDSLDYPRDATSTRNSISGLQSFSDVQALHFRLARPPDCTHRNALRRRAAGPSTPRRTWPVTRTR